MLKFSVRIPEMELILKHYTLYLLPIINLTFCYRMFSITIQFQRKGKLLESSKNYQQKEENKKSLKGKYFISILAI